MGDIISKFENKRVLLWGYGVEGKASDRFLHKYCKATKVVIFEGKREDLPYDDYDIIIKSPGVPYIYVDDPKMTSLTQLFLEEFKDRTIGITGTKGKSTTTSMIYKVLSDNLNQKVCLLGNIGIPCIDAYEEMKNGGIAVFEMSCHQLANTTVSPHIGIFLNLYEDHLDYYKTREAYFIAKSHIASYQTAKDYLYIGKSVPRISSPARKFDVSEFSEEKYSMKVLGLHNQQNADVAYHVAVDLFECNPEGVIKSLGEFEGLSHRLEKFDTIGEVSYFDDSISTIPEATINAIESVKDTKTVIVGGMDRGIDYTPLIECIKARQDINFILCYASGLRIYEQVKDCRNVILADDLKEAVGEAKKITAAGSVIMSPAAASYGYFKNFEERGEFFKKCVMED